VVLGTATLIAGPSRAGTRRAFPVDVGIGVGEDGFFYWHGGLAPDGTMLRQSGSWQSHSGWRWLRVRVLDGPPAEVRVVDGVNDDVVLRLLDVTPEQVREAVGRYAPDALGDDDPPARPSWEEMFANLPKLDPVDVEAAEEPDEPGELTVMFSDPISHRHQSLVAASVEVVGSVPGVTRAYQQDTEIILAFGTASPEEVKRVLQAWWDTKLPGWREMH
jgi:hypothetical protein